MKYLYLQLLAFLFLPLSMNAQFSGNALDFDGTNDQVQCASVPALFSNLASSDFTFEAWVNPRGAVFSRIFFAQPSTTNFTAVSTGTNNNIYFYVVANGTTYSIATTANLPQNQWTHVAARWTAVTSTPEVFFNGVLQAGTYGGSSSTGTNGLMTLGTRPGGAQFFNGLLDEARLWSEARLTCEITSNVNSSLNGAEPNLIFSFNFNQGTAGGTNTGVTNLPDLSGNSNNGTLVNFALAGSSSNWVSSAATVSFTGSSVGGIAMAMNDSVCSGGSYTFPDGSIQSNITTQVVHTSTIPGSGGCDSIITTTVGVLPIFSLNESASVCMGGSYTYPDGSTDSSITNVRSHQSVFQTAQGCDSIITTTVTPNPNYQASDSVNVCRGADFTFPDGFTQTGIQANFSHTSQLQTTLGCDSVIVTDVYVTVIDTSISDFQGTLYVTNPQPGATYQWLDCLNQYSIIPGETGDSIFSPIDTSGLGMAWSYAVEISFNGCTDTSGCITNITISNEPSVDVFSIALYPNPTREQLNVKVGMTDAGKWQVFSALGKRILAGDIQGTTFHLSVAELPAGIYLLEVTSFQGKVAQRFIKE